MKTIQIVGNGTSRLSLTNKINDLTNTFKYPIYACNLGYENLNYTKLFVIDDKMKTIISDRKIQYEKISVDMEYEPYVVNSNRPRNNTGMVAMQFAIDIGYTRLICYGFDFIIQEKQQKLSNIFDGQIGYEEQTRCSYDDTFGRIRYLEYMLKNNQNILFQFVFDKKYQIEETLLQYKNFNVTD